MIIIKEARDLARYIEKQKAAGALTGFVPTMGALHKGHLALIEECRRNSQLTICSIFVNPTQFNNAADFHKYPNTIDQDIYMLETTGTDILFLPAVEEVYPHGMDNLERYNLGYLETVLESKYRPGHFQGVCQVMYRLLTMIQPHRLYMGLKDYQQCMVIKRLLELKQLPIQFVGCPTVREPDGLAMSSRNLRLSEEGRGKAPVIYRCLQYIKEHLQPGNLGPLKEEVRRQLAAAGFTTDYAAIAKADTLQLLDTWDGAQPAVALIAAWLDDVRLIDNLKISDF